MHIFSVSNPYPLPAKAIPDLTKAETYSARKEICSRIAKDFFSNWNQKDFTSWKHFALIFCSAFITDTSFEGNSVENCTAGWLHFLDLWAKGKGLFLIQHVSEKHLKSLQETLKSYRELSLFTPSPQNTPLSDDIIKDSAEKLQKAIKEAFKKKSVIYLQLGYRATLQNDGHHLPCKIEQKKDSLWFTFLNKGEGSHLHPDLEWTSTLNKASFRYFPIEVSAEAFWGEIGLKALSMLMRYQTDPLESESPCYSADEVIDVFRTLGKMHSIPLPVDMRLSGKPQLYPTCSEKGVHLVLLDQTVDLGWNKDEINRFFLNARLCFLSGAYHQFLKEPKETTSKLLKISARKLGVNTEKFSYLPHSAPLFSLIMNAL